MRSLVKIILSLCIVFMFCCASVQTNINQPQPVKKNQMPLKSVVKISSEVKDGGGSLIGTAFAIDDNHLLTAGHVCVAILEGQSLGVLKKNIKLTVSDSRGRFTFINGAIVKKISVDYDLCLVYKKGHGLVPVKLMSLENYNKLKVGDGVWMMGAPSGVFPVYTDGTITSFVGADQLPPYWEKGLLFMSMQVWGGNSGSSVFSDNGEVIGVLVMRNGIFTN